MNDFKEIFLVFFLLFRLEEKKNKKKARNSFIRNEKIMSEENRELSICEQLTRPAEEFVNDAEIEAAWASSTIQHMEAYYKLIKTIDTTKHDIRLSKDDDFVYNTFIETFPDLNCENLTEDDLKSPEGMFFLIHFYIFLIYFFYSKNKVARILC